MALLLLLVGMLFLLAFPRQVHAYIDLGTGSYVLQIILAGIAAGLWTIKLFWGRIRSVFSSSPSKQGQEETENE